ncbi:MAG TPA: type 1 glutamine amidotransferase domain-containing protein [Spirochaetia bacterium]|nr:type 1 glutamine amidotransferase domain-containing protein [Spirochaetia bacterium]
MDELRGRTVAVLAEEGFEDLELWYPVLRLREAGAVVEIVGTGSAVEYRGKYGLSCRPDKTMDQVGVVDYDGVVIPGGWAPDKLRRSKSVLEFVRAAFSSGKVIGAICHAPWVLISAGVLRGRTVTCTVAIKDDVQNAGATYVDQPVVCDGNLITSRKPDDLPDFCRSLIAAMAG